MIKFNIGDKIVCPTQGVGIVDIIEEKEFNGHKEKFYKIHILNNTLIITMPFSIIEKSHVRPISDPITLDEKLHNVKFSSDEVKKLTSINYKERNEFYLVKSKSGTVEDYFELIFNLTSLKKKHKLNYMEKNFLRNAKKILCSEISISKNVTLDEAGGLVDSLVLSNV